MMFFLKIDFSSNQKQGFVESESTVFSYAYDPFTDVNWFLYFRLEKRIFTTK